MRKIIKKGIQARDELAKGAKFLSDAVSQTLGPYGSNWFLDKGKKITNDGVTIAKEIELDDEIQNLGVKAVREAALKTNDEAGDGTTTATLLTYSIYQSTVPYLAKEGVLGRLTPAEVVRKIETEKNQVLATLMDSATPIISEEQLVNSATVSVEDPELGKLIGKTQWELGKDGFIIAEPTMEKTSSVERVSGIRIDNGFGTSQVVTNLEKHTCEVEDTKVLLTTYTIKDIHDWQKLMVLIEMLAKAGHRRLVVVARAWTDETINYCLQNISKGTVKVYPFNAPYVDMQERMKDLAAVTGATFCDSETMTLEDLQVSDIGYAKKVVGRRYEAFITGPTDEKTQERVDNRVKDLEAKLSGSASDFEVKGWKERIAQLRNGFAILSVGSPSEIERKRLFDKCEDGVNAVRAALQEGTVKGAGLAFKEISDALPDDYILKRPLRAVYEQITSSAPADFVIEDWVRDPVKVLRVALTNACAAAGALATAGGAIAEKVPTEIDEIFGKFRQQG